MKYETEEPCERCGSTDMELSTKTYRSERAGYLVVVSVHRCADCSLIDSQSSHEERI